MRAHVSRLTAIAFFLILIPAASADLVLSLASESADLSNLTIGQIVRFNAILSGLPDDESLDYLAGSVTFDDQLFGTPTSVSPGEIVPDSTGFEGNGFPGLADAFYDALFLANSQNPITTNGTFYSFDVVALQVGSGMLAFDPTTLAAADGMNSPIPVLAGPSLSYTIRSVPEPGSLVHALILIGISAPIAGLRAIRSSAAVQP